MTNDLYLCEVCGKEFQSGWSHDDAEHEMRENWGDLPKEDRAILCDLCYHEFMVWMSWPVGGIS